MTQQLSIQYDVEEVEEVNFYKLGEIFKITSGGTPSRKKSEYYSDGDIPWVKTGDLKDKYVESVSEMITRKGLVDSSAKLFPKATVLIAMYGATIGATSILKFSASTNQACAALLPNERALPEYLYYFLLGSKQILMSRGVGGAQPNISATILKSIYFPLPPLPTQRKIAEVLDRADALRQRQRQIIAHYDQLAQSVFLDMFGDPVKNPKGWEEDSMEKVSLVMRDGPFGSNLKTSHYVESGVRVIRLQNIGINSFIDDDKAFISNEHYHTLKKHTCTHGDVLIATMGVPNIRACKFPKHVEKAINKADCIQVRPKKEIITDDYLSFLMNSDGIQHSIHQFLHGQTRTRVSKGQLATLKIPAPPLHLQNQFATIIQRIETQKQRQQEKLAKSEELFQSLLQRAFRGELFIQEKKMQQMDMF